MSCRGCIYKARKNSGYKCDYLRLTGHSRGCPIEGCTKRETKRTAERRRTRPVTLPGSRPAGKPGNWTAHKTRADKPGPGKKINEAAALELYRQGMSDPQIAAELGNITKYGVKAWRKRRGLPCQAERKAERKKAACEEAQTTRT